MMLRSASSHIVVARQVFFGLGQHKIVFGVIIALATNFISLISFLTCTLFTSASLPTRHQKHCPWPRLTENKLPTDSTTNIYLLDTTSNVMAKGFTLDWKD